MSEPTIVDGRIVPSRPPTDAELMHAVLRAETERRSPFADPWVVQLKVCPQWRADVVRRSLPLAGWLIGEKNQEYAKMVLVAEALLQVQTSAANGSASSSATL